MTTYAEPPDGSIVGWTAMSPSDPRWVYARNDDLARDAGYEDGERWWLCDSYSGMGDSPVTWSWVVARRKMLAPYLLTPFPLAKEDSSTNA